MLSMRAQDWIQDLKFSFTVPIDADTCPGCEVHQGFNENYVALRPQIVAALRGMDTSRGINIAGHSLGAAVSVLAAWDLVSGCSADVCTSSGVYIYIP